MANSNLTAAKKAKNDEFYTQFADIEKEVLAYLDYDKHTFKGKTVLLPCDDPEWSNFTKFFVLNFKRLGLKRLISTSYAPNSNPAKINYTPSNREQLSLKFHKEKALANGRIFTLTKDAVKNGKIDWDDIDWEYLEGDGDFRSNEIKKLRDEADIIVTNPPFSLFREFMAWIMEGKKQFLVIGSMNAITYKEIFPLIKENKLWLGLTINSGDREFEVPESYPLEAAGWRVDENGRKYIRVKGVRWFTNLEHGRRHQPLTLMTQADVERFGMQAPFQKYDNYDAIEVPKTKWIPSDCKGAMGVPISFLDKYCPEQFEILGLDRYIEGNKTPNKRFTLNGVEAYARIVIRHKNPAK